MKKDLVDPPKKKFINTLMREDFKTLKPGGRALQYSELEDKTAARRIANSAFRYAKATNSAVKASVSWYYDTGATKKWWRCTVWVPLPEEIEKKQKQAKPRLPGVPV